MHDRPKPPKELGGAGRALWRKVLGELHEDIYLPPRDLTILATACGQADTNAALEEALKDEGYIVLGASKQRRLNAAVGELRQGRLALSRLLNEVCLDRARVEREDDDDEFDALLRGDSPAWLIDDRDESS